MTAQRLQEMFKQAIATLKLAIGANEKYGGSSEAADGIEAAGLFVQVKMDQQTGLYSCTLRLAGHLLQL